jgi:hypothetical protein
VLEGTHPASLIGLCKGIVPDCKSLSPTLWSSLAAGCCCSLQFIYVPIPPREPALHPTLLLNNTLPPPLRLNINTSRAILHTKEPYTEHSCLTPFELPIPSWSLRNRPCAAYESHPHLLHILKYFSLPLPSKPFDTFHQPIYINDTTLLILLSTTPHIHTHNSPTRL